MTTGSLDHNLRELSRTGCRITIFLTKSGRFQANVGEIVGNGWISVSDADPLVALNEASRQRLTGLSSRKVLSPSEQQIDIEEAIAAAKEDEDLIG